VIPNTNPAALDFEAYVARHGESSTQALIERLERYEGVRSNIVLSLEERWQHLMHAPNMVPAQLSEAA
jgi:hypothetical protein